MWIDNFCMLFENLNITIIKYFLIYTIETFYFFLFIFNLIIPYKSIIILIQSITLSMENIFDVHNMCQKFEEHPLEALKYVS